MQSRYGGRMQTITFVRHGQSMANIGGVTTEHHTIALTDVGRAQAQALADLLPQQTSSVLVSPFERAQNTAKPYCSKLGITAHTIQLLHEFETIDPDLMQGLTGEQRAPLIDAYWDEGDVRKRMGPRAESFAEFAARVDAFRTQHLPQLGDGTVIFGHGMWIALLCWRLLGFSVEDPFAMRSFRRFQIGFPMPNGATYHLRSSATGQWQIHGDEPIMRRMIALAVTAAPFD